jgi:hypothetical protein
MDMSAVLERRMKRRRNQHEDRTSIEIEEVALKRNAPQRDTNR